MTRSGKLGGAMATFILVPGAGGVAAYWHLVVPILENAGHRAIAVELPGDDPTVGLEGYAERVIAAMGDHQDVVIVAQSLGGFTAAVVAARREVRVLTFVNAMIPSPNERCMKWWSSTGSTKAREEAAAKGGYPKEFDLATYFLHDVPEDAFDRALYEREEAPIVFVDTCHFDAYPTIPIHVLTGRDDRFFPLAFQRRIAKDRLGLEVEEMPGGHLMALSQPAELASRLLAHAKNV